MSSITVLFCGIASGLQLALGLYIFPGSKENIGLEYCLLEEHRIRLNIPLAT